MMNEVAAVAVTSILVSVWPRPASCGPLLSHELITCSVEVYVRVNLEFEECQNIAINNFTNNDSGGGNPCPLIKKIVETCADNVKVTPAPVDSASSSPSVPGVPSKWARTPRGVVAFHTHSSFSRFASTRQDGSAAKKSSSTNWPCSTRKYGWFYWFS